tara:strand:- start:2808 stop:3257 length:450 start_codon:yes stop_codon:yes gene_type:complete
MFVNPYPYTNGGSQVKDRLHAANITINTVEGYQGNPFVLTEDNTLERETYELQKLVDPGDPLKERELYHMFPGVYRMTSDTFVNVPDGHIAWLESTTLLHKSGCTVTSPIFKAGYKGLVEGQISVNGGEMFLEPGLVVAELVMCKLTEE